LFSLFTSHRRVRHFIGPFVPWWRWYSGEKLG
jgi:hypothetical protein